MSFVFAQSESTLFSHTHSTTSKIHNFVRTHKEFSLIKFLFFFSVCDTQNSRFEPMRVIIFQYSTSTRFFRVKIMFHSKPNSSKRTKTKSCTHLTSTCVPYLLCCTASACNHFNSTFHLFEPNFFLRFAISMSGGLFSNWKFDGGCMQRDERKKKNY